MDPSLYDEFGNYIGPDLDDEDDDDDDLLGARAAGPAGSRYGDQDDEDEDMFGAGAEPPSAADVVMTEASAMQIVLHEDKDYYPSASEVYGADVETLVQEEDAQPLSEPIIAPVKVKSFQVLEKDLPETTYSKDFLVELSRHPDLVRNVAVVGHLHHGKTALLDMLVEQTHPTLRWDMEKTNRYTDVHMLERDRGLSIKCAPMSLVMQDLRSKSYLLHVMDTPGHVDFVDEAVAALRLADGAVVVVDAVEGVMVNTERLLRKIVADSMPFVLVVNKIDRLIMELKLPPMDAYFKLLHVIEEVNTIVGGLVPPERADELRVSPERGNVCFASTEFGFSFSLLSFAHLYCESYEGIDPKMLARRLWGNVYYQPSTRGFSRTAGKGGVRSFVHFILEPLYKLFAVTLGESADHIKQVLTDLGIPIKKSELEMDVAPLLRLVMTRFFGTAAGFVDMVARALPSPVVHAKTWVERHYTGDMTDEIVAAMQRCALDDDAPLVIHVAKLFPRDDASTFDAFGRIVSGTVRKGQAVRVLGEGYSIEDEEDSAKATVASVAVYATRYSINVAEFTAGNWVLLGGVTASIVKTATIVDAQHPLTEDMRIFAPLRHVTQSVVKVAIEPVHPSELPKMLDGLRKINKSYPLAVTKVEESGEHVLFGPGELYLDCVLHDLRRQYADIEIKVSDPVTKFAETVCETSALKCFAESPNKRNKLTMLAEPLDPQIARDIENGVITSDMPARQRAQHFEQQYGWDVLASRSIWAFGPDSRGPNLLLDDTLPGEVDKKLVRAVAESIKQGFQWGTREGPLCDEPMRQVQMRMVGAEIAQEAMHRGGGQLIPTARRLVHASFLMAAPRLMEPVYFVEVQAPADCVAAVYQVLARRRGHVTQDVPKAGTPLTTVRAYLPVMDSFGFETDLRTHTQGQAFAQSVFDHFQMVPGDPLDRNIVLRPLEPSPAPHLARDFMIKTRRRKGLAEDVSVAKFLDDPMLVELARQELGQVSFL
ncbi:U5 small nuclear ribonucleoprotein component [Allomyces arbusculus]|nr:U5 small nuclear ribonucleoprotein component [Allomyces arbusculus]